MARCNDVAERQSNHGAFESCFRLNRADLCVLIICSPLTPTVVVYVSTNNISRSPITIRRRNSSPKPKQTSGRYRQNTDIRKARREHSLAGCTISHHHEQIFKYHCRGHRRRVYPPPPSRHQVRKQRPVTTVVAS